ncbi:unnamed protein product [Didymodactylos carnosus]|uniref:FAD dependent oxidoreductase domain-containing protein n=1 Tax=Didymodactylos carnosus TaxID=1234261 RepID=A0A813PDZ2_9BILA|nr:unnamed protein product [Didymodactylos carnosus]CAF3528392.1 unnamed protein product [Didymodactylos carnosus]
MDNRLKIAVVGIGGTGSATCRYLARSGHIVIGYEQFEIGHQKGSSHGESRIIRYTYPDILYTEMMSDAYKLWNELENEANETLFVKCGGLYFGAEDCSDVLITEKALIDTNLPYKRLTAEETTQHYPAVHLKSNEIALYQADSGYLRATKCVLANVRLAREYGATILENTPVTDIIPLNNGKTIIRTSGSNEDQFDRVIVTAGPWISKLFSILNLALNITRQQIVYLNIKKNHEYFHSSQFPVWIDANTHMYGFPMDGQIVGVKMASHQCGQTVTDLDAPRSSVDEDYIQLIRNYAKQRFPDLSEEITYSQTCLYTNTFNGDFIIDQIPEMANVFIVSGCSGHGFKFTVLLGKIVADLATGKPYSRDISRFYLKNFLTKDLPQEYRRL